MPQLIVCRAVLGVAEVIAATPKETLDLQPMTPSPQAVRSVSSCAQVTGQMSPPAPLQR